MQEICRNLASITNSEMRDSMVDENTSINGGSLFTEYPSLQVIRPHYRVTREVLDHMNPIAKLTAQMCLAHGTWELI